MAPWQKEGNRYEKHSAKIENNTIICMDSAYGTNHDIAHRIPCSITTKVKS